MRLDVIVEEIELFVQGARIPVRAADNHPGNGLLAPAAGFDQRFFSSDRIFFHPVQFVGDAQQGIIRICADFKHQFDIGISVRAFAGHLLQPFQIFQFLFLDVDYFPFDFVGTGPHP